MLMAESQSARMSKITNDTGYFKAVPYGNSGHQSVKHTVNTSKADKGSLDTTLSTESVNK